MFLWGSTNEKKPGSRYDNGAGQVQDTTTNSKSGYAILLQVWKKLGGKHETE